MENNQMADDTTSRLTVTMSADISKFQAKIAEAMADLEALAEKAGSLGIVIEADDGEVVPWDSDSEFAKHTDRVAAALAAHSPTPHR